MPSLARDSREVDKKASRTIGLTLLLAALTATALLAGCGSSEETGPLAADEQSFITNAERHAQVIQRTDPQVSDTVVSWKKQYPSGGLPSELYNPLLAKLRARDRAIQLWDNVDKCPSVRLNDLCDLWFNGLKDQSDWHNQLIKFVDSPYSQTNLERLNEAARKETQSLEQSQAEINKIKSEASSG